MVRGCAGVVSVHATYICYECNSDVNQPPVMIIALYNPQREGGRVGSLKTFEMPPDEFGMRCKKEGERGREAVRQTDDRPTTDRRAHRKRTEIEWNWFALPN